MNIRLHANATTTQKIRRFIQASRQSVPQLADVLRTHRFDSAASLQATLKRFVYLYNYHIPQKIPHHKMPLQTLHQQHARQPQFFKKNRNDKLWA